MTQDEIILGERARQLMQDELLQRILGGLEEQYLDAWKKTDMKDTEGREKAWFAVKAIDDIRTEFRVIAERGTLAAASLEKTRGRSGSM
jgi:uncharacterized protein YcaQ